MKNFYIPMVMFLSIAVVGCNSTGKHSLPQTSAWKSIDSKTYSISYPKDWVKESGEQFGTEFMLMSARTSPNDDFKENVNLVVQDFENSGIDLKKYAEISELQIIGNMDSARILSSKASKEHGEAVHKIIYTATFDKRPLKFEQWCWMKGTSVFVLTLTCETDQFDAYKEVGEEILGSFRLK
jgi:hypothetical protein